MYGFFYSIPNSPGVDMQASHSGCGNSVGAAATGCDQNSSRKPRPKGSHRCRYVLMAPPRARSRRLSATVAWPVPHLLTAVPCLCRVPAEEKKVENVRVFVRIRPLIKRQELRLTPPCASLRLLAGFALACSAGNQQRKRSPRIHSPFHHPPG